MFNVTNKAQNFYLNMFKFFNRTPSNDAGVKQYCQSEYGKDWYWAYNSYKTDGKFPNPLRRSV